MKTIGIFYGSSTGTTEDIAKRIATKLGVDASNLYDVRLFGMSFGCKSIACNQ